jgi:hypothetical protein
MYIPSQHGYIRVHGMCGAFFFDDLSAPSHMYITTFVWYYLLMCNALLLMCRYFCTGKSSHSDGSVPVHGMCGDLFFEYLSSPPNKYFTA